MAKVRSLETITASTDALSSISGDEIARIASSCGFLMMGDSGESIAQIQEMEAQRNREILIDRAES